MNGTETEEVGRYRKLDQCCKTHRKCPLVIHSNKTRWGYTNDVSYTLYDCKCDDAFYQCLKKVIHFHYKWHPQKQPSIAVSGKKVFWKYTANLKEVTHAELWFQLSYFWGIQYLRSHLEGEGEWVHQNANVWEQWGKWRLCQFERSPIIISDYVPSPKTTYNIHRIFVSFIKICLALFVWFFYDQTRFLNSLLNKAAFRRIKIWICIETSTPIFVTA